MLGGEMYDNIRVSFSYGWWFALADNNGMTVFGFKEVRNMGFVMEEFPIPGVGPFVCLWEVNIDGWL